MKIIFLILGLSDWLFTILACVFVNWWAPLFAYYDQVQDGAVTKSGYRLPNWLAWFDTFDGTLDDKLLPGEKSNYWTRMCWLYRNPGYGFGYWVLGAPFKREDWTVHHSDATGDEFYATSKDGRFCHKTIRNGVRYKTGWKVANLYDSANQRWKTEPWGPEWRIPVVLSISNAK